MSAKKRTPAETWRAIEAGAADDEEKEAKRIAALSPAEIDAELEAQGIDPAAERAEGRRLAESLLARRKKEGRVVDALEVERARLARIRAARAKMSRAELEARMREVESDPRLPAKMAVGFRNRAGEKASDEELLDVLVEMEAVLERTLEKGRG